MQWNTFDCDIADATCDCRDDFERAIRRKEGRNEIIGVRISLAVILASDMRTLMNAFNDFGGTKFAGSASKS